MKNLKNILIIFTVLIASQYGCKDVTDPPNPNEEELITSVVIEFTDTASLEVRSFKFADPDGEGGNSPTQFDTITLDSQSVYSVRVLFLDESGASPVDITEEVKEEAEDHLICYQFNGLSSITVTDMDANNLPLGLEAELITKSAESGTLILSLKHQPDIKNGSCDVGETDVEVGFAVRIE